MTTKRASHRYAALVVLAASCAISACSTGHNATPAEPPPPPSAPAPTSLPSAPSAPPSSTAAPATPRNVPPSEARDGTNTAACRTGRCQVAVQLPAKIQVGSIPLEFSLEDGYVATTLHEAGANATTTTGVGGSGSVSGPGGESYSIRVLGLTGDTAVLDITKQ